MKKRGKGEKGEGERGGYIMTNKNMQITAIYWILSFNQGAILDIFTQATFNLLINTDGACSKPTFYRINFSMAIILTAVKPVFESKTNIKLVILV